MTGRCRHRC